ncbi:tight adherence protein G [Bisgaardia hudsonensis]|uniref:Tight adherence protein G n=1 Tax=Bisgaardia hudsonensis TaxID=109472 RepID=A0A4R2MXW2_9PAST|nr:pilus assembly protein [Bisgaardia hudsonensis]QLB12346.1 hypothetical protein A6A11_01305 [Bisgaardia hudsonensis]TCP12394.1 tight adherence protein G [Bisgaardia hudsonensis]
MIKNKLSSILKKNMFLSFLKDEQGVYSIIMGLISLALVGFVALVVDGSGILLDKARFNQGMEQAGLLLVAENNEFRENKDHANVLGQQVTAEEKDKFNNNELKAKQDKRNKELIATIVRSYYLPNSYQEDNTKITDKFSYECGHLKKGNAELKSVACKIAGEFDRPSWLYMKQDGFDLSFDKTVKIKSDGIFVQKNLDTVPLDVMLVLDFTGSMKQNIHGQNVTGSQISKIDMLRNVVKQVSDELLSKESSRYNRLGFTNFAIGASQHGQPKYCYLPYALKSNIHNLTPKIIKNYWEHQIRTDSRYNQTNSFFSLFYYLLYAQKDSYFDLNQTVSDISLFDGTNRNNWLYYAKSDAPEWCLGQYERYKNGIEKQYYTSYGYQKKFKEMETTKFWYNANESNKFYNDFKQIYPSGGTLSSSGLLIGANSLMNKNTKPEVQPSKLGINTKRVLLVMSDGKDELTYLKCASGYYRGYNFAKLSFRDLLYCYSVASYSLDPEITTTLINKGMCEAIRNRLDTLQDENYEKQPAKIAFVFFGPKQTANSFGVQMQAWQKCVGQENLYFAESEAQLLDSFRQIIGLQEEVGHAASERPNF